MAGRTRKFNPVLSEQDKATLEKIVSSRTEEIRKVQRAKMILLAASVSCLTTWNRSATTLAFGIHLLAK